MIIFQVMSNLFSVKSELCGEKFELKVNDVRFVGHPTRLPDVISTNRQNRHTEKRISTIVLFNVVFALRVCINSENISIS